MTRTDVGSARPLYISTEAFNSALRGKGAPIRWLYDEIKRDNIKHLKIGRRVLVATSELEDYPARLAAR